MIRQRKIRLAVFFVAALLCHVTLADAYDPPASFYSSATGTGNTLKQQLHALIDAVDDPGISDTVETPMSYDAARSSLQVTDADPNQAGRMLAVYDRTSINVAAINPGSSIPGWDSGATWNREHTWPRSRGVGSNGPDDSDLFGLRPALTANNGDRGNLNFGGAFGQPWGVVSDGGSKWYPGDADAGIIARQEFYMATRYDGTETNTTNLELFPLDPTTSQGLGDLNRLLEWHFAAPPDTFERRRNQVIFDSYQHNRNPFIDHPEYVWSIFGKDSLGNALPNDSQVSIAGTTVGSNGSSTKTVNLGTVIVGASVPSAQTFTLNKNGIYGTYYEVTTSGAATSSITGRLNAFRTNQTDSKSITVGLNTTTATSGQRMGSVTIDNLDITNDYDAAHSSTGHAVNDANDTFNVSLIVLDHAKPSFTTGPTQTTSLTLDLGNVAYGDSATPQNFDVYNIGTAVDFIAGLDLDSVTPSGNTSAFATNLAPFAALPKASHQTFTASLSLASVGSFLATYILNTSDENLPGAQNTTPLTLTLKGIVRLAGDYNGDNVVDAQDYVVWQHTLGQSTAKYGGADGDGSLLVDSADYDVWRAHFGQTAPGTGSGQSFSVAVPEPATAWLFAISISFVCRRLRRSR